MTPDRPRDTPWPCGQGLACLLVLALSLCGLARAEDFSEADRQRFKQAFDAMTSGQVTQGFKRVAGLETYPLYPYLSYEYLWPRLHTVKAEEVRRFLRDQEGSVLGERLRTSWLTWLAQSKQWRDLVDDWRPQQETRLQCQYLSARVHLGETEGIAHEAQALWLIGKSQLKECDPAFEVLNRSPLMTDDLVWQRITLAMAAGETALAGYLAKRLLAATDRALVGRWVQLHQQPARNLDQFLRDDDQPRLRLVIAHGIRRLARQNFDDALRIWSEQRARFAFTAEESGDVDLALAMIAARADDARALDLFVRVPAALLDGAADEACLRIAVSRQDWSFIIARTEASDPSSDNVLAWRYWRARALEATGADTAARGIYAELARERDYYGFLAADRLGVPYSLNQIPTPMTDADKAAVGSIPGIVRARELLRLGYTYYARREWHFEVARVSPREQAMLAVLAHEWAWHDRAIITMGYTGQYDDLDVRFPIVYRDLIEQYAERRGIDAALLYSIIRAESAFMDDARSPAGALGLMQMLPATGRETAGSIGVQLRDTKQLLEAPTNILLGSAYLKQMLDRFGGSFPMAAAAYNAGPHRVRNWRPASACMPPDLWVEAVPFRETRRYVKQTLFYAAVYESRLQQQVTPLAVRLSSIQPQRPAAAGTC